MITVFNRACVYTGFDMKAFADIRAVLEQNNIPYRYKLRTRTGQWTPDGTIRAHTGSYGENASSSTEYAVYVQKSQAERAQVLIGAPREII